MNLFRKFRKNSELEDCDPNKIQTFSFENIETMCKIVSFYDGDSCTIVIKYFGKLIKLKCRLKGIDTPEIRSDDVIEKMAAQYVKRYVSKYHSKILKVRIFHNDKYGRQLVEIFDNGCSINEDLIKNGMAYRYDGKTKKKFLEWYNVTLRY